MRSGDSCYADTELKLRFSGTVELLVDTSVGLVELDKGAGRVRKALEDKVLVSRQSEKRAKLSLC